MLQETTDKGDRNPSSVNLLIQFQRSGIWNTEFDITINGKITTQYLASVVADNLPPRPFSVRMVRVTPDSTTDRLQNKTLWRRIRKSSISGRVILAQRLPVCWWMRNSSAASRSRVTTTCADVFFRSPQTMTRIPAHIPACGTGRLNRRTRITRRGARWIN